MRLNAVVLAVCLVASSAGVSLAERKVPDEILFSHYRVAVLQDALYDGDGLEVAAPRVIGYGTGIGIGKRDILTAAHVAPTAKGLQYRLDVYDTKTGKFIRSIKLKLIKTASSGAAVDMGLEPDLALLEADEDLPSYTKLKYAKSVAPGDEMYCIGARRGLSPYNVSWGVIASLEQASVVAGPGNSGGGCFNGKDEFIGVLAAGIPGDGIIFFVTAAEVENFLRAE